MGTTPEQRRLTVLRLTREQLGLPAPQVLTDDQRIIEDLHGDSLDTVELIMAIEDEFCIEIPDTQLDSFDAVTVGMLIAEVERRVQ